MHPLSHIIIRPNNIQDNESRFLWKVAGVMCKWYEAVTKQGMFRLLRRRRRHQTRASLIDGLLPGQCQIAAVPSASRREHHPPGIVQRDLALR